MYCVPGLRWVSINVNNASWTTHYRISSNGFFSCGLSLRDSLFNSIRIHGEWVWDSHIIFPAPCHRESRPLLTQCTLGSKGLHNKLDLHPFSQDGWPIFKFGDPHRISGTAESRDFKFFVRTEGWGPYKNYVKLGHKGSGVTWPTFGFCDRLHISGTATTRVLRVQCVRCIRCSLCQITLASCYVSGKRIVRWMTMHLADSWRGFCDFFYDRKCRGFGDIAQDTGTHEIRMQTERWEAGRSNCVESIWRFVNAATRVCWWMKIGWESASAAA